MKEKRNQKRVTVNWAIRIHVHNKTVAGKAKNISLKGILIDCEDPIPLNRNVSMTIFPINCKPIDITGMPIWSNLYGLDLDRKGVTVCIGLSFIGLATQDQHLLKAVIEMYSD